jgi:hypothetical protein
MKKRMLLLSTALILTAGLLMTAVSAATATCGDCDGCDGVCPYDCDGICQNDCDGDGVCDGDCQYDYDRHWQKRGKC